MPSYSAPPVRDSWIAFAQPKEHAAMRLFCFAHAGGGASLYREWPRRFGDAVDVCPVQLPGRENRIAERPIRELDQLLDSLATVLGPLLDRPFAFFGHSLGALVAFELVHTLRARGQLTLRQLFVSASPAPSRRVGNPQRLKLSDADLLKQLAPFCTIPQPLLDDEETWQLFLPALRADFAINDSYSFADRTQLSCPIAVFGARDDEVVAEDKLRAWSEHTHQALRPYKYFLADISISSRILTWSMK